MTGVTVVRDAMAPTDGADPLDTFGQVLPVVAGPFTVVAPLDGTAAFVAGVAFGVDTALLAGVLGVRRAR